MVARRIKIQGIFGYEECVLKIVHVDFQVFNLERLFGIGFPKRIQREGSVLFEVRSFSNQARSVSIGELFCHVFDRYEKKERNKSIQIYRNKTFHRAASLVFIES